MYIKNSIERNIAATLVRYIRALTIDNRDNAPYDHEHFAKTQMMAKQIMGGEEKLSLIQFIKEEAEGGLAHYGEYELPPDMTKEEKKRIDEDSARFRLLMDATDEQYHSAFEISRPYIEKLLPHLEKLLPKYGSEFERSAAREAI